MLVCFAVLICLSFRGLVWIRLFYDVGLIVYIVYDCSLYYLFVLLGVFAFIDLFASFVVTCVVSA